jgi:hypothetical protein
MQTQDCAGETDRIAKCSRRKGLAGEGAAVPAVAPRLSTMQGKKRPHGMVLKASNREWRVGAESARCFRGSRVLRFKFILDPIVKWRRVNCR